MFGNCEWVAPYGGPSYIDGAVRDGEVEDVLDTVEV